MSSTNISNNSGSAPNVPEVVIQRLPLYVRALTQFAGSGDDVISSEQLGQRLQMTPAQIRKDLSYFGRFGKQGRGYSVASLEQRLRSILGLNRAWNTMVIGMGRLGRAVVSYPGFAPEGFNIVAAFDADDSIVGETVSGLDIQSISDLAKTVKEKDIKIGIVTVPIEHAQEVIDTLVDAGIKSILNYAPLSPKVPEGVTVRGIDPVLSLQSMTYYIS
ncbi:MAG TPA: redox-sensing transcriptional repressor Rex [Dehalococcoidia bacterium]|nr:redox-sensing transcriptional repressor Rex [Dehalococcoidia bacterium]HIM59109.1 redox-sensing transcriptional repressor Rex [Dehalococcoidia bacterium]|tara:strand:+ start:319 stop:969 length:651 start_codon:yes stop_codon:yes gene_type:complete